MPISAHEPLLEATGLCSGYGKIAVLHGIDLRIGAGEVVSLLGPNGAGKTTLLRAISGLLPPSAGRVRFGGAELTGADPRDLAVVPPTPLRPIPLHPLRSIYAAAGSIYLRARDALERAA